MPPQSQHYIPQFLLRGFLDPSRPTDPVIWAYNGSNHQWKRMRPRRAAALPGFYTITNRQGEEANEIETYLSQLENKAAKILRDAIIPRRILNDEQRCNLAEFIAAMFARVPFIQESISGIFQNVGENIAWLTYQRFTDDPEGFEEHKRNLESKSGLSFDGLLPEHLNPSNYRIIPNRAYILGVAFDQIERIMGYLLKMSWTFLHTTQQFPFIISDNPVAVINPTVPIEGKSVLSGYGHGFVSEGTVVTLPLSQNVCFMATWLSPTKIHMKIDADGVNGINIVRMIRGVKYLFSPSRSFPGSDILDKLR